MVFSSVYCGVVSISSHSSFWIRMHYRLCTSPLAIRATSVLSRSVEVSEKVCMSFCWSMSIAFIFWGKRRSVDINFLRNFLIFLRLVSLLLYSLLKGEERTKWVMTPRWMQQWKSSDNTNSLIKHPDNKREIKKKKRNKEQNFSPD